MALNIVTGVGPRVGSSFVMQQCKAKGLNINGTKFLEGILPKEGNPKGYEMYMDGSIEKVQNSDFDLFDLTWDYGVDSVHEDWEFTDYEVVSREQYVNATTKEEEYSFPQGLGEYGEE